MWSQHFQSVLTEILASEMYIMPQLEKVKNNTGQNNTSISTEKKKKIIYRLWGKTWKAPPFWINTGIKGIHPLTKKIALYG